MLHLLQQCCQAVTTATPGVCTCATPIVNPTSIQGAKEVTGMAAHELCGAIIVPAAAAVLVILKRLLSR
jgi:hypothetical protein